MNGSGHPADCRSSGLFRARTSRSCLPLLERYLRNEVFPKLDAEEKATAQVRALIVGFISTMHTLMTEQYFADKYHGERNDRRK